MEYPKNGSVVIIDDKIEEVEDLIVAFSKRNVPTYYFTGKHDKLHRELNNIKIIFLDINYTTSSAVTKAEVTDNLIKIIKSIINKESKDYIIITWSTTTESYHELLQTRLQAVYDMREIFSSRPEEILYKMPKHIFSINKTDVKTSGIFDISKINEKINSAVPQNDIMNLTTHWENNVLESAKNVLRNFENIAPTDEDQKKIYALFADSMSQTDHLTVENILSPSLAPISNLLSDQISSLQLQNNLPEIAEQLILLLKEDHKIEIDAVSKINTFYHVDSTSSCNNSPGTVYSYQEYMNDFSCSSNGCNTKWSEDLVDKVFKKVEIPTKNFTSEFTSINTKTPDDILIEIRKFYPKLDALIVLNKLTHANKEFHEDLYYTLSDKNKKTILKKFFIETKQKIFLDDLKNSTIPIFLEFSPDCDFVQGKRKKLRLIFGLLIPYNFQNILAEEPKLKAIHIIGDNIITTPIINYCQNTYQVIFDLHTVTGINEEAFSRIKPIFRFRKELLVDVQQKVASHIARPGFFNMNDYLK